MKFEDLTGKRFERFIVIRQAESNKYGHPHWICRCDCGAEKRVSSSDLKRGHRRSCGCLRREISSITHILPKGEAAFNALYSERKAGAIKRGHTWLLDPVMFKSLVIQNCHYCGSEPSAKIIGENRMNSKPINGNFIYNGIDRKNNDIGYLRENCVTCCKTCNFAKNSMSYDEFIGYLDNLVKFRTKKNLDS